ncbi:hypothetical protein HYT57_00120 [Candidatus Woesearchaeota archaeon]|nr:hypothetical protein [Candidatus Woesearchaeota archaeon]
MSIYMCLKECKPDNIIIDTFEDPGYRMGNKILISSLYNEEEQIVTILHELLHDLPEFRGKSTIEERDETVERRIEDLAQEIYKNRPVIREFVRKQLTLAKKSSS